MYTIEVHYETGDSFDSWRETEDVGLVWESKHLAKKALAIIQEHYLLYKEFNSYGGRENDEILQELHQADWYELLDYCDEGSIGFHTGSPVVEMDDGESRHLPTHMWCGYFERLISAKVTSVVSEEDIITF